MENTRIQAEFRYPWGEYRGGEHTEPSLRVCVNRAYASYWIYGPLLF